MKIVDDFGLNTEIQCFQSTGVRFGDCTRDGWQRDDPSQALRFGVKCRGDDKALLAILPSDKGSLRGNLRNLSNNSFRHVNAVCQSRGATKKEAN